MTQEALGEAQIQIQTANENLQKPNVTSQQEAKADVEMADETNKVEMISDSEDGDNW